MKIGLLIFYRQHLYLRINELYFTLYRICCTIFHVNKRAEQKRGNSMKKNLLALALSAVTAVGLLAGCGGSGSKYTIAVPNDTTNEARALLLLQEQGIIKLDDDAGITATVKDIKENPYNVDFKEVEAAQVPNVLKDVNYAVINSNYALDADLNPVKDALATEDSSSAYGNVVAVKEGNENEPLTKALVAALESQQVKDFITKEYDGAIISTVDDPGDGYDDSVDYDSLAGQTITVAASPTPHAEILKEAAKILAEKNITLDVKEFTDYVQPNKVVDSGEIYANYFQHQPYLDDFNKENGTHVVSVATIHVEPMGIYPGKSSSLDDLKK